jgi:hypothetical protein
MPYHKLAVFFCIALTACLRLLYHDGSLLGVPFGVLWWQCRRGFWASLPHAVCLLVHSAAAFYVPVQLPALGCQWMLCTQVEPCESAVGSAAGCIRCFSFCVRSKEVDRGLELNNFLACVSLLPFAYGDVVFQSDSTLIFALCSALWSRKDNLCRHGMACGSHCC